MSTADMAQPSADLPRSRSLHGSSDAQQFAGISDPRTDSRQQAPLRGARSQTDDEILGLDSVSQIPQISQSDPTAADPTGDTATTTNAPGQGEAAQLRPGSEDAPAHLQPILGANPELRQAWQDARAYRQCFSTPEDARAATAALADLDRMDLLFFSSRSEDHTQLARAVAALNPAAFKSLAQAMAKVAGEEQSPATEPPASQPSVSSAASQTVSPAARPGARDSVATPALQNQSGVTAAQEQFFHAVNAEAVEGIVDAIESQVDRLLPEGIPSAARNRVVGEIYRELDSALRSNQQLAGQVRDAFRSGSLDDSHRRAIASLVTGRARQALPAVAKRVLNEWTATVVAANLDRRSRQRIAERRVDVAGSGRTGDDGRRPLTTRDIDYSRMSDADILNL